MELISPNNDASHVFRIAKGKQLTLHATGLQGSDHVVIEILRLSESPPHTGNPCCFLAPNVSVLEATPLSCVLSTGVRGNVRITATVPYVVLEAPQEVDLHARVVADPGSVVTVFLNETDSSGCTSCTCQCFDEVWQKTGEKRCNGNDVEAEEQSNCGTTRWVPDGVAAFYPTSDFRCTPAGRVEIKEVSTCGVERWVDDRAVVWNDTGATRCRAGNVEKEQTNDCGAAQWIVVGPVAWTDTAERRCRSGNVERQEADDCGALRWVVHAPYTWTANGEFRCVGGVRQIQEVNDCGTELRWTPVGPVTWTPTGETRCKNGVVENQEADDCGNLRWTATATPCDVVYCPSGVLPMDRCDGQAGYAFQPGDARDPAATVALDDCDGATHYWLFPTAGTGHTIAVKDCDGTVIGYAANASDCAGRQIQTVEVAFLDTLRVQVTELPPVRVAEFPRHVVSATTHNNTLYKVWSDGVLETVALQGAVTPPAETTYCPSLRLSCDGTAPGFGFHAADPKDPAATVALDACDGTTETIWIYPAPGPGHTVRVMDDQNNVVGYACNVSSCAEDVAVTPAVTNVYAAFKACASAPDVVVNVANTVSGGGTSAGTSLVALSIGDDGKVTATNSDGTTVTSNSLPSC